MQVVCCQVDTVWQDKAATHARVEALLATSPPPGGALVVLPEQFSTGSSFDLARIAETEDERPSETFLAETAAKLGVYLIGGVVTRGSDGRGRNEAVVLGPDGRQITRYCKMHPFSFSGETEHFESGDRTVVFACHDFQVAPLICYDLRFPEVFRATVRQGAQLFVVIANWPEQRIEHWVTLLRARAIENQAYVVGVNRCGREPQQSYPGRSLVIDPYGQILADPGTQQGVIRADLDLHPLIVYLKRFPALQYMRPENFPKGRRRARQL